MSGQADPRPGVRRVLVVDDDPDLCQLIRHGAARASVAMDTVFVSSFLDAVRLIDEGETFDLILADFMLADSRNGYELRQFCRDRSPGTPFALMSSMPLQPPERDVEVFLQKPFSPAECRAFLESRLAH